MCTGNCRCQLKNNPSSLLLASSLAVGRESEASKNVYYSLLQPHKMLTLKHVSWQGSILAPQAGFTSSAELQAATTTAFAVYQPACMCFMYINTVFTQKKVTAIYISRHPEEMPLSNSWGHSALSPYQQPKVATSQSYHIEQTGISPSLKTKGLWKCHALLELVNSDEKCQLAEVLSITAIDTKLIALYWIGHSSMGTLNYLLTAADQN